MSHIRSSAPAQRDQQKPWSASVQGSSAPSDFSPWHWTFAVAVALGGALGAVCRYTGSAAVDKVFGSEFPLGILLINIVGCFLMGLLQGFFKKRGAHPWLAALLGTGFLGGLTTFSSFALDTFTLYHGAQLFLAALNIVLNLCVCMAAVGAGYALIVRKKVE